MSSVSQWLDRHTNQLFDVANVHTSAIKDTCPSCGHSFDKCFYSFAGVPHFITMVTGGSSAQKVGKFIIPREGTINVHHAPYTYELVSVTTRHTYTHFTSTCLRAGQWYKMNDMYPSCDKPSATMPRKPPSACGDGYTNEVHSLTYILRSADIPIFKTLKGEMHAVDTAFWEHLAEQKDYDIPLLSRLICTALDKGLGKETKILCPLTNRYWSYINIRHLSEAPVHHSMLLGYLEILVHSGLVKRHPKHADHPRYIFSPQWSTDLQLNAFL